MLIFDLPTEEALAGAAAGDVYIASDLKVGENYYSNNNYFVKQNELNYPNADVKVDIQSAEGGLKLALESDKFARALFLSTEGAESFFEDNYFDLRPREKYEVFVRTSLSVEEFKKCYKMTHLIQTK